MLSTPRAHAGAALAISALALAVAPQACSLNQQGELFGVGTAGGEAGASGSTASGGGSTMSGSSGGLGGGGTTSSTGSGGKGGDGAGGAGGAGGDVGGAGGMGGSGGAVSLCGNGIIDPGEECDSKDVLSDSCIACQVTCVPPQAYEDMATHHCYFFSVATSTWDGAVTDCEGMGYYLAALNSQAEIDFLKNIPSTDLWVGASKTGASWSWLDGEAVNPLFWESMQPDNLDEFCVELGSKGDGDDAGLLNNVKCDTVQAYLCEWTPPGNP